MYNRFGKPGGGVVYQGLWELEEGALGMGYRSLKRLRGGGLGEDSFTGKPERWGFWEICKMPCRRASLSMGALLGNLEGFRLPGLLRKLNSISEYLFEPWGHSGFKSEWDLSLTQTYISGFLLFGPRG